MRGVLVCIKLFMGRVEICVKFGGDGDVDLNGDVIGEDFYLVFGLVCLLFMNFVF